ncbi:MAG: DUF1073 domain-containing protein [Bacteroidales bacterium]|nr:DUF1073 domain-containing protein [Bacteroidales bacterium]
MTEEKKAGVSGVAVTIMRMKEERDTTISAFDSAIHAPKLPDGVVPKDVNPLIANDSTATAYSYLSENYNGYAFKGYAYLASLASRAEYRAFSSALSTEITREFIKLYSNSEDDESSDKIKQIEAEFKRLDVRGIIQHVAENDTLFGRGQIALSLRGHDNKKPLVLSNKTIALKSLERIISVEPMWTTPEMYDAIDPLSPSFYKPSKWFLMGKEIDATRLLTVITRPVPDMLKPAFNFSGISLSQVAEPYVENWLRTRQSISDLIAGFSITTLKTDMSQVLSGEAGEELLNRAKLFTAGRANQSLSIIDKETEEIDQVNTPLSGLHELQTQAREQLSLVSKIPTIVLSNKGNRGLGAGGANDAEIKVFYDWINATQEAFYRKPLEIILKVVQLSLFGEIDEDIGFNFVSLDRMSEKEQSEINLDNANGDAVYLDRGVLSSEEVREKLANDDKSGYNGIDLSVTPEVDYGEEDQNYTGD